MTAMIKFSTGLAERINMDDTEYHDPEQPHVNDRFEYEHKSRATFVQCVLRWSSKSQLGF